MFCYDHSYCGLLPFGLDYSPAPSLTPSNHRHLVEVSPSLLGKPFNISVKIEHTTSCIDEYPGMVTFAPTSVLPRAGQSHLKPYFFSQAFCCLIHRLICVINKPANCPVFTAIRYTFHMDYVLCVG